jgi:hypothetical protein
MKNLLAGLITLGSISSFAGDLFCGVYLVDLNTDDSLAHQVVEKQGVGMSSSNYQGKGLLIEKRKKRFLRKSLVLSQVSFAHSLINEGDSGSATFQFYRESEPNKHGIFMKTSLIGKEIIVNDGEIKFDIINDKYSVKSYCNIKH